MDYISLFSEGGELNGPFPERRKTWPAVSSWGPGETWDTHLVRHTQAWWIKTMDVKSDNKYRIWYNDNENTFVYV